MFVKRCLAAGVAVAFIAGGAMATAAPAQAKTTKVPYSKVDGINCGTVSKVRQATLVTSGTYIAQVSPPSSYVFSWDNHKSSLSYSTCGKAAPYGAYTINAQKLKLTNKFVVTNASLSKCKVSTKTGLVYSTKDKGKASFTMSTDCALGKKHKTRVYETASGTKKNRARVKWGGNVKISGGYFNSVYMGVYGQVTDSKHNFSKTPLSVVVKGLAA